MRTASFSYNAGMKAFGSRCVLALAAAILAAAGGSCPAVGPAVEGPELTEEGLRAYTVTSEYLKGPNVVEVLLPDRMEPERRYPVLYILPVNEGSRGRWGSGILEAKRTDVHNRHGLICVAPAFDSMPWYADHPTDPKIRQESYLLKVVLPLVEERHPALKEPRGRMLIGFSKSGWGAFSLLLRHPDLFGKAAAWDAPLVEERPERFEMRSIFGTEENFAQYRITSLLEARAPHLRRGPPRLVLGGYSGFRNDMDKAHARMQALEIPHVFDNTNRRAHRWDSGWFAETVARLVALPEDGPAAPSP